MTFDESLAWVLQREGGLVDDPADPGGRTNLGITQKTLDAWRAHHPEAPAKVDDLTPETVAPIYRDAYWFPAGCDGLHNGALALVVFDTAVNCGVGRAKALLSETRDWPTYLWRRLDLYVQIVRRRPASLKFLPGWSRRLILLQQACQS